MNVNYSLSLPRDVLGIIFRCLPEFWVQICKCVSKEWYSTALTIYPKNEFPNKHYYYFGEILEKASQNKVDHSLTVKYLVKIAPKSHLRLKVHFIRLGLYRGIIPLIENFELLTNDMKYRNQFDWRDIKDYLNFSKINVFDILAHHFKGSMFHIPSPRERCVFILKCICNNLLKWSTICSGGYNKNDYYILSALEITDKYRNIVPYSYLGYVKNVIICINYLMSIGFKLRNFPLSRPKSRIRHKIKIIIVSYLFMIDGNCLPQDMSEPMKDMYDAYKEGRSQMREFLNNFGEDEPIYFGW
jgi:hypothetical protein